MKKNTLLLFILLASIYSYGQGYTVTSFIAPTSFTDISSTGQGLSLTDDGEANITSSFPISFDGQVTNDLRVGNNGAILIGVTTGEVSYDNGPLTTSLPMLAPLWDDLYEESGDVYWQDFGSFIIIQWDRSHYDDGTNYTPSHAVFQVKIFSNDTIYFLYHDVDFGNASYNNGMTATIGVSTLIDVYQFSIDAVSVVNDMVIKFEPLPTTEIPDTNFENYLETHNSSGNIVAIGDVNSMGNGIANDGLVYTSRIESVTSLNVIGSIISDLSGIEKFTALTFLDCSSNNLTSLDVSQNIDLIRLRCRINNLTVLNVDANVNLTELNCSANNISTLNIDNNIALEWFACYQNFNISTLNLSNNTELIHVDCHFMSLTSLNTNSNGNLETLRCLGNDLETLNLENNTNLINLACGENEFSSLNLDNNVALEVFNCSSNPNLASLNIQNGANNLLSGLVTINGTTYPRFIATDNPSLTCVFVNNATDANNGVNDYQDWQIDATATFTENYADCSASYDAPVNNECIDAINLTVGTDFDSQVFVANNLGSTETVGVMASCGDLNPEIWFTVIVPTSGNVTIETRPESGSMFSDSIIAVFSGSCGALTEINCNDDNEETEFGTGLFSTIELTDQTPGAILYVTAYSYDEEPFGEFKIAAYDNSTTSTLDNTIIGLSFYPNPVKNILHIQTVNNIESIKIYSMLGQQVLTKKSMLNEVAINVNSLSVGNYIIKIQSNKQVGTYQFIKQ